jgi:hypothetical protein
MQLHVELFKLKTFIETGCVPPFAAGGGSFSNGNASPFQGTYQFQGHDYYYY